MTAISITPGYPNFSDTDGSSLNDGYVFIGLENQDPITAPTGAFWDKAFQVPADQPLRTSGGYIVRNGTPAAVYTGAAYSILVQNKNLVTVYNAPSAVITNVTNDVEIITQYQGAHATDPIARNDGTPLETGDLYFNTVVNELKVWTGTVWVPAVPGTVSVENFTGTGAQTAFNLATAPVAENNTQIYIDGVYQQKDTYTLAGSTINFSTAPPNLSGIEVVTFSISSLGTTDASNVSYNEGSAGAVNTSVQAKLQENVSVKDFGAAGDGVTDDTAAIQAALDAAKINGDALFFPEGRYIVSSPLILPVKNGTYRVPLYLYGTSAENAPDELGSIIEYTGTSGSLFEGRGVSGTDTRRTQLKVENIQLYGTFTQGSLTNTTVGFNLYASTSLELNNVLVFGFQYGMLIEGGWWYSAINNVKFRQSKTAVKTNGAANGSVFRNCSFANVDDYSVQADYFGFSINFDNCWFEGGGITEVLLTNGGTARIQNSYFETVGTGAVVEMARSAAATGQAPMLYITGCDIQSSGGVDHVVSLYNAAPENANMTAIFSGIWCQLTGKNGFVGASGGTNTIVYELGQINYFNNPVIPLLTPTSNAEEVKVNADGFFAKQATIISATGGVHNLENTSTAVTSGDFFGKINFVSNDASTGASGNVAGIYAKAVSDFGAVDLELYSAPSGAPMVAGLTLGSDGKVYAEIQDFVTKTSGKGLLFSGDSNIIWRAGSGTPEGAVTAPVGSMYTRSDGGASTTLYVKESGAGNTGWVAK